MAKITHLESKLCHKKKMKQINRKILTYKTNKDNQGTQFNKESMKNVKQIDNRVWIKIEK